MKINDDTIRQLRHTQAQKNLPVYPAPVLTDTGTQHYTDAESEELPDAGKERQAELWRRFTERADRLGVTGTVRSDARKAVQSRSERKGNLIGNALIFSVCVFAVGFLLMVIAACWH